MRVTRFHHFSVNTNGKSLADVVAFYREVLGLSDIDRPDIPGVPGHWHAVDDQQLHLVAAASAGSGIDPTGQHYCVMVEDLDAAATELEERGISHIDAVQRDGTVQIWLTDPAGNTIELQQDPSVG